MSSDLEVHQAVFNALTTIDGTGDFNMDLSGDEQVVFSDFIDPDRLPMISATHILTQEIGGPEIGDFEEFITIRLLGFVASDEDTAKSRVQEAQRMIADVKLALRTSFSNGPPAGELATLINEMTIDIVAIDGESIEDGGPFGIMVADFRAKWFEDGC